MGVKKLCLAIFVFALFSIVFLSADFAKAAYSKIAPPKIGEDTKCQDVCSGAGLPCLFGIDDGDSGRPEFDSCSDTIRAESPVDDFCYCGDGLSFKDGKDGISKKCADTALCGADNCFGGYENTGFFRAFKNCSVNITFNQLNGKDQCICKSGSGTTPPGGGGGTPPPNCGNGTIESAEGEQCDGTNLGGATCESRGFTGGSLSCKTNCTFNTSACTGKATIPVPPAEIINPLNVKTLPELLNVIVNFIFWIGITIAPIIFIIAGFIYVTSAGSPQKVETAKNMLLYGVIGLALLLLAKGLVAVLKSVIGVT